MADLIPIVGCMVNFFTIPEGLNPIQRTLFRHLVDQLNIICEQDAYQGGRALVVEFMPPVSEEELREVIGVFETLCRHIDENVVVDLSQVEEVKWKFSFNVPANKVDDSLGMETGNEHSSPQNEEISFAS